MSEIFTASNEVKVRAGKVAGIHIDCAGGTGAHDLAEDETEALREFFQHERDQELGRWRWIDSDWVAIEGDRSREGRTVIVVNERTLLRLHVNELVRELGCFNLLRHGFVIKEVDCCAK